jgi:predicted ATPase
MRLALEHHDALLRQSLQGHGGFVFKTVGDAFYAAFATAPGAVAAALAAQQALLTEAWAETGPLRVRMALHTGIAEVREGDYFGPTLNRVSRMLDAGHGGQVLLTLPAEELVRDELPDGASLRPLGEHRLKDLARSEQIFQLLHPDLPAAFPPLRSLAAFTHNLPLQWTCFIGREKEMEEVKRLLPTTPLMTLSGMGGSGKTRLALQAAADLLEAYSDGVWLVELAALEEPLLVPQAVATALGVPERPGRPLTATLIEHLRSRSLLLILDNCEHLLAACAQLVDALLRACPSVRILATSRERLGLTGERVYPVPSLSLPPVVDGAAKPGPAGPSTSGDPPSALLESEAVCLFVERAVYIQPLFTLTEQNAVAVARLCQRLDGIPLALELAAARVKAMPVEQLAARLDDAFRLLTGGSRTALPRQQTLRALIDWSYDLLSEAERALLQRLSVFAGGWSLEAAEAVCTNAECRMQNAGLGSDASTSIPHSAFCILHSDEVFDLLTSLVEKSLVVYEERDGEPRYRLLETVRHYGRDRLLESGKGEAVRDRHFAYFLRLSEQDAPAYPGQAGIDWLERLEKEHDNLRAALAWRLAGRDSAEGGLRMVVALWCFWMVRGHLVEGHQWVQNALENRHPASRLLRARALLASGFLAWFRGEFAAAQQVCQESLALWREEGDRAGMAFALALAGIAAYHAGSGARAVALMEECLAHARDGAAKWPEQLALLTLGSVARDEGDLEKAAALMQEGLELVRELGERVGIAYGLRGLGDLRALQGHHEQALTCYAESLTQFQGIGERRGIAHALDGLAKLACLRGRARQAAELYGAAQVLRDAVGAGLTAPERRDQAIHLDLTRAALGDASFAAAWAEGQTLSLEEAIDLALEGS